MTSRAHADADGVHVSADITATCDSEFDGRRVWSFVPTAGRLDAAGDRVVPWPADLRPFLDGTARVTLREHGRSEVLWEGEIRFGDADPERRVQVVDPDGRPLVMTKWGWLERSFELGHPEEVERLFDLTERLLRDLNEVVGVPAFVAYGTLLGAVRAGRAIGHDNDADIAYLSRYDHPADLAMESFRLQRRLRQLGWRVERLRYAKIGLWDGAADAAADPATADPSSADPAAAERAGLGHVDVFVAYYRDGQFNLDQWIAGDLAPDRVLPLRTVAIEGRRLPAPADPAGLLALTYGPRWAVPDPSETRRVHGWFAAPRLRVNAWTRWYGQSGDPRRAVASDFAHWAAERLGPHTPGMVIDAGCGTGADARLLAGGAGRAALGFDFCPAAIDLARAAAAGTDARFLVLSMRDTRAALARATHLAMEPGHKILCSRMLLDALNPAGRENLWRFLQIVMARGGLAFLEFRAEPGQPLDRPVRGAWTDVADVAQVRARHGPPGAGSWPGSGEVDVVLGPGDPELTGGVLEDPLHGQRVGQRHDRALAATGAHALRDLDQLVGVSGTRRRVVERLGLGAVAVQHESVRVVEAGPHVDPARGAEDPRGAGHGAAQRDRERGRDPGGVPQQQRDVGLDPGRPERAVRDHPRRGAEDHVGEGHHVDAQVEQGATAELGGEQAVGRVVRGQHAEIGLDRPNLADRALGQ